MNEKSCAPTCKAEDWASIDWNKARAYVKKLQMRIVKAQQEGHYSKVKTLQWLLTHSFYAKALAVKRVTSNRETCLYSEEKRQTAAIEYSDNDRPSHADFVQVCTGTAC